MTWEESLTALWFKGPESIFRVSNLGVMSIVLEVSEVIISRWLSNVILERPAESLEAWSKVKRISTKSFSCPDRFVANCIVDANRRTCRRSSEWRPWAECQFVTKHWSSPGWVLLLFRRWATLSNRTPHESPVGSASLQLHRNHKSTREMPEVGDVISSRRTASVERERSRGGAPFNTSLIMRTTTWTAEWSRRAWDEMVWRNRPHLLTARTKGNAF